MDLRYHKGLLREAHLPKKGDTLVGSFFVPEGNFVSVTVSNEEGQLSVFLSRAQARTLMESLEKELKR